MVARYLGQIQDFQKGVCGLGFWRRGGRGELAVPQVRALLFTFFADEKRAAVYVFYTFLSCLVLYNNVHVVCCATVVFLVRL